MDSAARQPMTARVRQWLEKPLGLMVSLFVLLVVLYHVNGSVLDEGDSVPSINLPLALLDGRTMSFDVRIFPEMFKWNAKPPFKVTDDFYFWSWKQRFGGRTAREWKESGELGYNGPRYYIVQSPTRHVYVNTFGPVPGMLFLPFMAVVHAIDPIVIDKPQLKLAVAKLFSSMLIAAVAVMLFAVARRYTTVRHAMLIAVAFALGTCAWAISSQNLWQQTVSEFLLVGGAAAFLIGPDSARCMALSGLAFGTATANRPTSIVVFGAVAMYVARYHRRRLPLFLLAAAPTLILVGIYNERFFGSPFRFAQELVGHSIAQQKTGSPDLWQTPFYIGLPGLLASPSRGLLVFSPFLALSFWGAFRTFRDPRYRAFRPLIIASLFIMAVQCKWFDWWGGWTYGYRPWVDLTAYLCVFLIPVIETATATRVRRIVFNGALAWAIFVQAIGAWSYDRSWNNRRLFVVRLPGRIKAVALPTEEEAQSLVALKRGNYIGPTFCDIDLSFCRYRLWSISDNIIWYQLQFLSSCRSRRLPSGWYQLGQPYESISTEIK